MNLLWWLAARGQRFHQPWWGSPAQDLLSRLEQCIWKVQQHRKQLFDSKEPLMLHVSMWMLIEGQDCLTTNPRLVLPHARSCRLWQDRPRVVTIVGSGSCSQCVTNPWRCVDLLRRTPPMYFGTAWSVLKDELTLSNSILLNNSKYSNILHRAMVSKNDVEDVPV